MNEPGVGLLASRLAVDGEALCAWAAMNEPAVAESLTREAFDAVALDMQHGDASASGILAPMINGGEDAGRGHARNGDRAHRRRRAARISLIAAFGPATAGRLIAQGATLRMVRRPRQTKDAAEGRSVASSPVQG